MLRVLVMAVRDCVSPSIRRYQMRYGKLLTTVALRSRPNDHVWLASETFLRNIQDRGPLGDFLSSGFGMIFRDYISIY